MQINANLQEMQVACKIKQDKTLGIFIEKRNKYEHAFELLDAIKIVIFFYNIMIKMIKINKQ